MGKFLCGNWPEKVLSTGALEQRTWEKVHLKMFLICTRFVPFNLIRIEWGKFIINYNKTDEEKIHLMCIYKNEEKSRFSSLNLNENE